MWIREEIALNVNPTAHFDILDSDTSPDLICHLETNIGGVRTLHGYRLTKENLVMLQQGGCILLSYRGRNCLNQANCIKASFTSYNWLPRFEGGGMWPSSLVQLWVGRVWVNNIKP